MLRKRLRKTSARVRVTSEPAGAYVRVELMEGKGVVEGVTPFSEWVVFGNHRLVVSRDGFEAVERGLVVAPGSAPEVALTLKGVESGAEAEPPPPDGDSTFGSPEVASPSTADSEPEPPSSAGDSTSGLPEVASPSTADDDPEPKTISGTVSGWLPWFAFSLGAGLLGGGIGFGVLSGQEEEARDELLADSRTDTVTLAQVQERDDTARGFALVSNLAYGAGAVAVGVGAYLLLSGGDEAGPAVGLLAGPGQAGLTLTWEVAP